MYVLVPPSTSPAVIYLPSFPSPPPAPLPSEVTPTADASVAFKDIDVAILVGAMPRREGMERKDLLKANAKIFETQGKALDQYAKKTVKVEIATCSYGAGREEDFEDRGWGLQ